MQKNSVSNSTSSPTSSPANNPINNPTNSSANKKCNEPRLRKRDRRSLYTEAVIKKALLEKIAELPFGQISISAICRQAEITRPTFYLHYNNLSDVLNELIDEMALEIGDAVLDLCDECGETGAAAALKAGTSKNRERKPFCQLVLNESRYSPLFKDDYIAGRIVERIVNNAAIAAANSGLANEEVQKLRILNLFRMSGCLAAAKSYARSGQNWNEAAPIIDNFVAAGFAETFTQN